MHIFGVNAVLLVSLCLFRTLRLAPVELTLEEIPPDEKITDGPQTDEEKDKEALEEETADLFEGDMVVDPEILKTIEQGETAKRSSVTELNKLWPGGKVPYVFDSSFEHELFKNLIKKAAGIIRSKTCVTFVPRTDEKEYVTFKFGTSGCFSSLGKMKRLSRQVVQLSKSCAFVGTVLHEMMHTLGFFHEQSRLDRDHYVTINWNNIQKHRENQFRKYSHGEADFIGEPYDYDSILHYPRNAFSANGLPTILPINAPWREIGRRDRMSDIDIKLINKLYKCNSKKSNQNGQQSEDERNKNGHQNLSEGNEEGENSGTGKNPKQDKNASEGNQDSNTTKASGDNAQSVPKGAKTKGGGSKDDKKSENDSKSGKGKGDSTKLKKIKGPLGNSDLIPVNTSNGKVINESKEVAVGGENGNDVNVVNADTNTDSWSNVNGQDSPTSDSNQEDAKIPGTGKEARNQENAGNVNKAKNTGNNQQPGASTEDQPESAMDTEGGGPAGTVNVKITTGATGAAANITTTQTSGLNTNTTQDVPSNPAPDKKRPQSAMQLDNKIDDSTGKGQRRQNTDLTKLKLDEVTEDAAVRLIKNSTSENDPKSLYSTKAANVNKVKNETRNAKKPNALQVPNNKTKNSVSVKHPDLKPNVSANGTIKHPRPGVEANRKFGQTELSLVLGEPKSQKNESETKVFATGDHEKSNNSNGPLIGKTEPECNLTNSECSVGNDTSSNETEVSQFIFQTGEPVEKKVDGDDTNNNDAVNVQRINRTETNHVWKPYGFHQKVKNVNSDSSATNHFVHREEGVKGPPLIISPQNQQGEGRDGTSQEDEDISNPSQTFIIIKEVGSGGAKYTTEDHLSTDLRDEIDQMKRGALHVNLGKILRKVKKDPSLQKQFSPLLSTRHHPTNTSMNIAGIKKEQIQDEQMQNRVVPEKAKVGQVNFMEVL